MVTLIFANYSKKMKINKPNHIKEKIIQLTKLIENAFKDVSLDDGISWREADVIDSYGTLEKRKEVRLEDEKNDWLKVPFSLIGNCYYQSVLPFFDIKGLKFYLPIIMIYSITNYKESDSLIIDCLIYTLIDKERVNELKIVLNKEQKNCVINFLKFCLEIGDDYYDLNNVEKKLQEYWIKDLIKTR